jgi:hypothetical protein
MKGNPRLHALCGLVLAMASLAGPAAAQPPSSPYGPTPLGVDFKRAPLGTWAEYAITVGTGGTVTLKNRWAFLARDAEGNTLELTMEGPAVAAMGGKVVTRMVLRPDPIGSGKPIKQLVMQVGDDEPLEIPVDIEGLPGQKFQNPDPKKLVGKPTVKVAAGSFATSQYHDVLDDTVVDSWISEQVPPLGVVKIVSLPRPGAVGPGGKPLPPVTMELIAHGKGARPVITRPAKRFDTSMSTRK